MKELKIESPALPDFEPAQPARIWSAEAMLPLFIHLEQSGSMAAALQMRLRRK